MSDDMLALEAGLEALRLGDRPQAIVHFTEAIQGIQTGHQRLLAFYHRGQTHLDLGQIYEAVSDLTVALTLDPGYVPALKARSLARLALKNPVGALQDAEAMIQADPHQAAAYQLGGVAARRSNQIKQAIGYFTKAARLYLTAGNTEAAKQCLAQAERLRPQTPKAIPADFMPNSALASSQLGNPSAVTVQSSDNTGLPGGTIADFTTPKAFYAQAIARAQQGDTTGAFRELSWALANVTIDEDALCCRGTIHSLCGQWQDAIKDFNQAIRLNPNYVAAYRGRGKARYRLNDCAGAIEDLSQALALMQVMTVTEDRAGVMSPLELSTDHPEETIQATHQDGVERGNHASARETPASDALASDAMNCAMLYTARAVAYRDLGQLTAAMADLNAAIAWDEQWADAYLERGTVYARQEELVLAAADYQKAASLFCNQERWDDYNDAIARAAKLQPVVDRAELPTTGSSIEALQQKLLRLVGGYWEIAARLLDQARYHHPGMSDEWYLQYVIADIEDEYGSDI